jgi:surface polysaccharide O-acyltransferase-like enzyme
VVLNLGQREGELAADSKTGPQVEGGKSARQRLDGLDAVKAVAAVGVVAIHAVPLASPAYSDYVVGGVARLAVPIFVIVSGFLAGLSSAAGEKMRANVVRFVRLHLVWGLFYWCAYTVAGIAPDSPDWKWIVGRFGEGGYPGQYYFIIMIQIYVVCALPALVGSSSRPWENSRVAIAAFVVSVLVLAGMPDGVQPGQLLGDSVFATIGGLSRIGVWHWFFYFALGASLGRAHLEGRPVIGGVAALGLVVVGTLIAAIGWPLLPAIESRTYLPYTRLSIVLGATAVGLALPFLAGLQAPRWLRMFGRNSFGIFVLNAILVYCAKLAFGQPASVAESLILVAVVSCASVGLSRGLARVAPWSMR